MGLEQSKRPVRKFAVVQVEFVWPQQIRVTDHSSFPGTKRLPETWAFGAEVGNPCPAWTVGHPRSPWVKAKSS